MNNNNPIKKVIPLFTSEATTSRMQAKRPIAEPMKKIGRISMGNKNMNKLGTTPKENKTIIFMKKTIAKFAS